MISIATFWAALTVSTDTALEARVIKRDEHAPEEAE
jgi:hypothetical protein